MVVKAISVRVKPGHLSAYLAAQGIWNDQMRSVPGHIDTFVGRDAREPETVHVHVRWRSRADLARFMASDHDRIAALAGADAHYDGIEVRILEETSRAGR